MEVVWRRRPVSAPACAPRSSVGTGSARGPGSTASPWRPVRPSRRTWERALGPARASAGEDVLVVMEGVVRVVFGLDLGESPVDLIAVGLSNPVGVVVGIEEVDVDAAGAMRLEGLEEPTRPGGLGRGVLARLVREPDGVDDDVVGDVATGVGGCVVGNSGDRAA